MTISAQVLRLRAIFLSMYEATPRWAFWLGLVLLILGVLLTLSWLSVVQ